jgi:tRNA(Ile)-lysidine synthase
VDHGLRDNFQKEAALVEGYCALHELPWVLVRWEGVKPKTGIMAAARVARYRLLADAAHQAGARHVLTGHTLDDQNETLKMRALRGVASPIEQEVLFERRIWISRPLLLTSRAKLRGHLIHHNIAFADDPTNLDLKYERARIRAESKDENITPPNPLSGAALAEKAAAFVSENVKISGQDVMILRPNSRDLEAEQLALRYLAAALGQFEYPAPADIAARLSALLDAGDKGAAFTAQRCRFQRVTGGVMATREARHFGRPLLSGKIQPFEMICAKSYLPLANAMAAKLGAPHFILPPGAAI